MMTKSGWWCGIGGCAIVLGLLVGKAAADPLADLAPLSLQASPAAPHPAPPQDRTPFAAKTTAWHLYAAYASPLDDDMADDVFGVHVGWAYYFRDNLAIVPEVALSHVDQRDGPDAVAVSFHLMIRAHLLSRPRYSLYIDLGSGAWYGSEQVPPGGTRFNFPLLGGLGLTYRLDDRLHLMTGARYWHISNGFMEGRGRNPSHDGIQAYVGVLWETR